MRGAPGNSLCERSPGLTLYERGVEEAKSDNNEEYNTTLREIIRVIDKLKGNSPGYDDIHNSFLKNLHMEYYEKLRGFNKI